MRGRSEVGSLVLLAALLLVLSFPTFAQAFEETRHEITPRLSCETVYYDEMDFWSALVRVRPDGSEVYPPFGRWLRNSRARLMRLRSQRRAATHRSLRQRLRQRIQRQRAIRMDVVDCRDGELSSPDDSDNNDDNSGGGGDGGNQKPAPGSDALACDVFGDSSSSGQFARIINGTKCPTGDSPVVLLITSNGGGCTGTAITPRVILSAGHCFTDIHGKLNVNHVRVYTADEEDNEQEFISTKIKVHPSYNGAVSNTTDDSALVIMDEDLPVRTMEILKTNDLQEQERLLIAGYGRIGESIAIGNNFDSLHGGGMRIHQIFQGNIIAYFNFHDPQFPGDNSNTCNGDSGGPAAVFRDGKWLLAGITSYGQEEDCGEEDFSGFQNITDPGTLNFIKHHVPELF